MTNIYKLNGRTVKDAAKFTCRFLEDNENMETQCLTSLDDEIFIQARARHGKYKQILGLDKALSVKFNPIGNDYFSVEIGEAKWADKGIALATSWFVFWPLAVTSGIGIYKQKSLPGKIIRELSTAFIPERKLN